MHDNKGTKNQLNGYNLLRAWFNYRFDNPDQVKHVHTELFTYVVDLWNRLRHKEKFGLPTRTTMEATGIGHRNTFYDVLDDLEKFGFIETLQKAPNQHQSRIIKLNPACIKNDQAQLQALDQANLQAEVQHCTDNKTTKQSKGEKRESKTQVQIDLENWIAKHYPEVSLLKYQLTPKNWEYLISTYGRKAVEDILAKMDNYKPLLEKYNSVYRTALDWLRKDYGDPAQNRQVKSVEPVDPRGKTM